MMHPLGCPLGVAGFLFLRCHQLGDDLVNAAAGGYANMIAWT
jgi:hypothetical protein